MTARYRLRTKILAIIVGLIIVVGLLTMLAIRFILAQKIRDELLKRGMSIAQQVSRQAVQPLLTGDRLYLQMMIDDSREVNDDVEYVFVTDQEDAVRAHTFSGAFPEELKQANRLEAGSKAGRAGMITRRGVRIYDIAWPIVNGTLGTVHVGLREKPIRDGVNRAIQLILMVILAVLVLGIAAAMIFSRVLAGPLEKLADTARKIGAGDFEQRVPVEASDEIGELSLAFNRMVDDLAMDIAHRRRVEEALRASEERYRMFLQNFQGIAFQSTIDYRPIFFSGTVEELTGYREDEFLAGRPLLADIIHADDREDVVREMEKVSTVPGYLCDRECRIVRKDGELRWVRGTMRNTSDESGNPALIHGVIHDVTSRKAAQEALKQAKEVLERQNEELKKMDRMKDNIIRGVSHELKTPIAKHAMQMEILTGMLEGCDIPEQAKKALRTIDETIRRQEKFVHDLLDLSRLEAGAWKYSKEPVALDQVVAGVVEDYRQAIDSRGVKVTLRLESVVVVSDADMLGHVFSNLVNNALKFLKEEGAGRLEIVVERRERDAVARISDNGIGMSAQEQERIFEKFYRGASRREGSGVGLSICKMIVEDLGGRITLESAGRGKGTTAVVTLPLVEGKAV